MNNLKSERKGNNPLVNSMITANTHKHAQKINDNDYHLQLQGR